MTQTTNTQTASPVAPSTNEPISFLGIRVHRKNLSELNALVGSVIASGEQQVIANHNLHSLHLYHRDARMRDFYAGAEWTHVDGMALVALARLCGHKINREHRITYVDWVHPLVAEAARNHWRIFYLGGAPGVAERGAAILHEQHLGLQIKTVHGYFDTDPAGPENRAMLAAIAAYRPHILMVGMGMPRQENWIHDNRNALAANVILPCGAVMDYVAGAIATPPRWAGRTGLEWAFRLANEPRRLWQRYLVEPWSLSGLVVQEILRNRTPFGKASAKQ